MHLRTDYARRGLAVGFARRAPGMRGWTTPGPSPIGESWAETKEYCKRLHRAIETLRKDARAQIVYRDPKAVAEWEDEWMDGPSWESKLLTERAAKRGAAQTAKDLIWAGNFDAFRVEWETHYETVMGVGAGSSPGFGPVTAWERTQVFEGRFRDLYWKFASLGSTKPSEGLPETYTTPDGKPHDGSDIPWTGILVVGGIIGLATFSQSIVKLIRGS